jgi:hypothetical protein
MHYCIVALGLLNNLFFFFSLRLIKNDSRRTHDQEYSCLQAETCFVIVPKSTFVNLHISESLRPTCVVTVSEDDQHNKLTGRGGSDSVRPS